MTGQDDAETQEVPAEELETALRFLEWSHGKALERCSSGEAHAYYQAIDIVEDAIAGELKEASGVIHSEEDRQVVERSREARETGYREATLFEKRYAEREEKADRLLDRVKRYFVAWKGS